MTSGRIPTLHDPSGATRMTCTSCQKPCPEGALFCPMCGAPQPKGGDPLLGTVLAERYLLKERIGEGGSGTVYRSEHVSLRRKVAVKILHHQLSSDDLALERFRREAMTVAELENEHILKVLDFGRAPDGRLFFVMELLEGETLATVLKRERRLAVPRVVDVLIQLCDALMEPHALGYVHRDLRPANVFLARKKGQEGFVKLLDFGLAKLVDPGVEAGGITIGMTFGEPLYMSPEQARGEPLDRRSDVYAMGCMAYEMLTGKTPFGGGGVFDVLTQHLEARPEPVEEKRTDTPPWLADVVMRALAKKPEERFVTVLRMAESLRAGQAGVERAPTPPPIEEDLPTTADPATRLGVPVGVPLPVRNESTGVVPRPAQLGVPVPVPRRDTAIVRSVASGVPVPVAGKATEPVSRDGSRPVRRTPQPTPKHSVPPPSRPVAGSSGKAKAVAGKGRRTEATHSGDWFSAGDEASRAARVGEWPSQSIPGLSDLDDEIGAAPSRGRRVLLAAVATGVVVAALVTFEIVHHGQRSATGDKPTVVAPIDITADPAAARPQPAPVAAAVGTPPTPVASAAAPHPVAARPQKPAHGGPATPPKGPAVDPAPGAPGDSDDTGPAAEQADLLVKVGRQALFNGDVAKAAASFEKAHEIDAKDPDSLAGLGDIALQEGQYAAAADHFRAALRLDPHNAQDMAKLGEAEVKNGDTKAGLESCQHALKLEPDLQEAATCVSDAETALGAAAAPNPPP